LGAAAPAGCPEPGQVLLREDVLNSMQLQRRISLQVPHFSVLPKIIPGTDLLAVLPAQIARLFMQDGGLRMLELPFQVAEAIIDGQA